MADRRILVRLSGEVTTKGRRVRRRFQAALTRNVREACRRAGGDCRIDNQWSRLFVDLEGGVDPAVLGRIFGISSYSELEGSCPARVESIVRLGTELFADRVRGRKYAVRARRSGTHSFTSQDVMRALGTALNEGATVDLGDPDVEVCVEIRDDAAYLFSDRVKAAGGLPLGVEGRAVALLSGGFDSAVAAWMLLRRGVNLDYVFCNLGGAAYRRMVIEVAKRLSEDWSYGTSPRLYVIEFDGVVKALRDAVRPAYLQVALKRQMYRAASRIAERTHAEAIVTGEAIGQVSSQTLANLLAIDDATTLPVLRPLVGFDKEEIISRSREIGTYELSARVREYCSISDGHPATAANREAVRAEDEAVDPAALNAALAAAEKLVLNEVDLSAIVVDSLFLSDVPDDAIVIDTRDRDEFEAWHWPGALNVEFTDLAREFPDLDREPRYLLYCAQGLLTAQLAETMQDRGYEAYSFPGGVRPLRKLAEGADIDH
jgi:thiamine biosynthesis protein ThiI